MKDKVIEILMMPKSLDSIHALCTLCNIRDFQANSIIDEYKKLYEIEKEMINKGQDATNYSTQKGIILRGLTSGEYSKPENIASDLKREIIKYLTSPMSEENCQALAKLCNIDPETSKNKIEEYQKLGANIYDTTSTTLQSEIINNLIASAN